MGGDLLSSEDEDHADDFNSGPHKILDAFDD